MNPRRRLRSLREKAWWLSAQSIVHIVAIGVVVCIIVFGDSVKIASIESQQLMVSTLPSEVGAEANSHHLSGSKIPLPVDARALGESRNEQNPDLQVHGASLGQQKLRQDTINNSEEYASKSQPDVEPRAHITHGETQQGNTAGAKKDRPFSNLKNATIVQLRNGMDNILVKDVNASQGTILMTLSGMRHSNMSVTTKNAKVNLADFHKHAQERALQDAFKKRAALKAAEGSLSQDQTSFDQSSNITVAQNPSIGSENTKNDSSPHRNGYRGIQETKENGHLFKSDNVTHLSYMLYRLIRTHDIASLIDIPCTSSVFWMPDLLQRLEFEIPKFHYRCIVPNDEHLMEAVLRYQDLSSVTVVKDPAFWASKLPPADLAFVWYGMGFIAPKESWQLLKALQQSKTKYVIVPNNPNVLRNQPSGTKHGRVNVRRAPYLFNEPMRVVNNMSNTQLRKQLLMYDLRGIRKQLRR